MIRPTATVSKELNQDTYLTEFRISCIINEDSLIAESYVKTQDEIALELGHLILKATGNV
jgi:hypothetical protein